VIGVGIGKTTLLNEMCVKWAKSDGFLAEDFDIVMLIPLRSVQQRSLEEAIMEHIGEETYEQMKKSEGSRSLIMLDGWDEIPVAHLDKDPFLAHLIKDGGILAKATVLITSRPHVCLTLEADKKIELVGFDENEVQEFVQKSFSNNAKMIEEFMQQFKDHAALCTICYTPKTLEMIVNLFKYSHGKLPQLMTKLYQQLIMMFLNSGVVTKNLSVPAVMTSSNGEGMLHNVLQDIPKEAVGPVLLLSKMAYHSFFDWHVVLDGKKRSRELKKEDGEKTSDKVEESKETTENKVKMDSNIKCRKNVTKVPKLAFTVEDLVQSGISNSVHFNGYGLLITCDKISYSFAHLAIQEILCALHVSTLSEQEQHHLMNEHFHYFPSVFVYLCGLTGLKSSDLFQFVFSILNGGQCERCILTAVQCLYESQHCNVLQSTSPFSFSLSFQSLQPYDCLCTSHILSCYKVDQLRLGLCFMGNKGIKMLTTIYPKEKDAGGLVQLYLWKNDLTADGMEYVMKIVMASKSPYNYTYQTTVYQH